MPLLITPGQFTRRSEFYHQLAQLTAAGLPVVQALEQLKNNPPARSYREPVRRALEYLAAGRTFAESLQAGQWLPVFDIALVQAGEQSGRLPVCFQQLSDHYRDRAQLMRATVMMLAYPLCVLHFAILIFPLNRLTGLVLHGETLAFLLQKLMVLGPLYGIVVLVAFASQGKAAGWRALVEYLLHCIPILGRARRSLAIARLSSALESLISAGMTIIEAWELAADASASPALQRAVRAAKPQLTAGTTPAEMVRDSPEFPGEFARMYYTGEISGKLDESLDRARVYFQEEGARKLKQFVFGSAGVLIAAIMLFVAWQVIHFYLGYFQQIQNATEGF
jgi:type II secretory pathway component PulF